MAIEYTKLSLKVAPLQPGTEVLIALLGEIGFDSFVQTEFGVEAYIPSTDFDSKKLPEPSDFDFIFSWHTEHIPATNWNAEWEANFEPVEVDSYCYIRAPFHPPSSGNLLDVVITPKMSFGTGHHNTTWLMCKCLFEMKLKEKLLLDMGCGTGILAIVASKLGAKSVTGIDIDEWSIENSIENEILNSVKGINWILGNSSSIPAAKYDVILANINRNVLMNDLPVYYNHLSQNGKLLLSGFFTNDISFLVEKANFCGFELMETFTKNEWASLLFNKK